MLNDSGDFGPEEQRRLDLTDPLAGAVPGRGQETRERRPGAGGAVRPRRRGRCLPALGGGLHLAAAPRPEGRSPASRRRRRLLAPERALPGVRRTREAEEARAPAAAAATAARGAGGGGRLRGGWPSARWWRWWRRRRRPWGCSAAPAAEGEQRRRAQGSGGVAEAAEVRAGELPGPPCLWGNGLAARRGRPGGALLLVAVRHAGTLARPAPSAPGLGAPGARAAEAARVGRAARAPGPARPAQKGRDLPGPWLPGCGRAGGPERGNVSGPCCPPARGSLLSPRAPRRGPGWGKAGAGGAQAPLQALEAVRGRRHPLRREWRLRHEWRAAPGAVVAVTDTSGVSAERGRFRRLLACSRAPSSCGRRLSATTAATSEARDSFGQSGCGPCTRCSGGVRC
ncbi:uncharacterized protein LOC144613832 [Panthera onca]